MSVTNAALVLSWVAIAILALAYAGLRRQLSEVHAGALLGSPTSTPVATKSVASITRSGRPALVLLTTDDCPTCLEIGPVFREIATASSLNAEHVVLMRSGSAAPVADVPVVVDPLAFNTLEPGYLPALVLADQSGVVLLTEPVGSVAALEAVSKKFHSTIANAPRSESVSMKELS